MFIDIDYDKRKKGYKINLAKPNQQTIASVSEAYGANYSIKLGNINEVTFNVPYFIDKLDERVKNENIELIKERMYTKISYNNNDEWMIIDTIEDVGSGDEKYMTVTAFTNVYETSNRKISELNLEVVNPEEYYDAVLNDVAWSIGTIDPLFKDIYRSVELSNVTVLEAIITGAETFGAVLDFDTENKKINLIDMDSRAKYRGLNINYSNFLQSINRKRSVDEMTTRLYVYGSEDLSIENVNPTGMRYLEDFTYFLYPFERDENKSVIKSSHYMSDELAHAILDKNELSEEYQPLIQAMQEEIDEETIEYINETTLLNGLRFDEMSVSGLLDIAKATGDNDLILQRQGELAETKTKISIKELTVDHINATIEDLERQISQLQSQISVTSFSKELYDELSMYIIESEFRDDRYIDEEELYRDALKKFDESKSPSVVIEASIDNIIDSLEEDYYSDKVVLGDIARVTDKEMSVEMKSLIVELSFDLDNNTCDVTIANGDIEKDGYDRILSVLYDTQSTTTMLENNKYKWDTVTDVKTEVDLMRDGEIDATRNRIKAGFRESVTIEDRGIILSNPDFPNEIVIMQAGVIALSTDGGENWSTSITPRGVMADTIIGKLVASNNLIVTNDSGSFRIDGDGLTVDMDSIKIMSGEGDTPENIVDSWNKMLITMDEFADDGKLNEYEKNQIARQWNSIAIAHSSMVDAIQNAYGPETPENPYPAEYEIYMESYEELRGYLNDEIQSDGHTILDPLHRSETTNIDSDKYNRLVSDYEVNKDRFQTVIPLEFSQTFMEQTRHEISLNYVKNGEVATKLNLSEEGVRIDGRLLEVNSETHFNDDLVMNAGLIRSADGAINIDLNAGVINLSRPLTINAVPVATEKFVEENMADAIKNIDVEYGISSDKNTPPSDWNTTPPAWEDGKYIWSRTLTVYKNGNTEITEPVNITGAKGSSGGAGQAGRSVKSIQEQYYLSTSPLDLENGSWIDNPPEWEADKYIWTRSVVTYENPSGVDRTEPVSVSGQQGPKGDTGLDGKDAPIVKLSGKTQIIKVNENGRLTPSTNFTVTGSSVNTVITTWRYSVDGGDFVTSPPIGVARSGATITVNPSLVEFDTLTIRVSDGRVSDDFTIARAVDGAKGEDGEDSYTVVLTNESHTFAGNIFSAVPSSTTADIIAYKGDVRVPVTVDSITGTPTGMSTGISSNGTINTRVTFTVDEELVEESGTVKLNLVLGGNFITKEFSFAVAYKGERGEKGERGATGNRGPQGDEGVGISSITEHYLISNQSTGVTYNTSGWGTSIPTMTSELRFLWNYEEIHFTDGTSEPTLPVVVGVYGQQGPKGSEGEDGRSIIGIEERYLATSSASGVTRSTSGWKEEMQVTTPTKKYLWNYEIITWSKAPLTTYVEPIIIGIHGDKGETGEQGPIGLQGQQGPEGKQGIQGPEGKDGISTYTHIAYATSKTGADFSHSTFDTATYIGMYVSNEIDSSEIPTDYEWTLIKGKDGSQGLRGPEGKDGRTPYFHTAWANNSTGTSGFSTTVSNNKLYIGTVTTFEIDDPEDPSVYSWTKIKGDKGDKGDEGTGVSDVSVTYQNHSNGTTAPTGNWSGSPNPVKGTYLWARTITSYTDGEEITTYNVSYNATDGQRGPEGPQGGTGTDGTGVSGTEVRYAQSISGTTVPTSGWQENPVPPTQGQYNWTRTIVNYTDGTKSTSYSTSYNAKDGVKGDKGDEGKGILSTDVTYQNHTNGTTAPTGTWNTTIPTPVKGQYLWTRTVTKYTEGNPITTYSVSYYAKDGQKGDIGDTGPKGDEGTGVNTTTVRYSQSTSGINSPASPWDVNPPTPIQGQYNWTRTVITYTDGSSSTAYSTSYNAKDGLKGDKGEAGKGIKSQVVTYQNHSNGTTAPTGSWTNSPSPVKGQYLWTRTVTQYTEGDPVTTYAVAYNALDGQKGDTGDKGGEGTGISSTVIRYFQSTSGTTTPTGDGATTPPTPIQGQYNWTRTVITYTDGTKSTAWSTSYNAKDGQKGDKGDTGSTGPKGDDGKGIHSQIITYQNHTNGTTAPTGSWVDSPSPVKGQYLWTRTVTTYTTGNPITTYSVAYNARDGQAGGRGPEGTGISSSEIRYQQSTSGSSVPSGTWQVAIPAPVEGRYLWTRTTINYTDGTNSVAYSTSYYATKGEKGEKGDTGATGPKGAEGTGVKSAVIAYAIHTNGTTAPTSGWQATVPSPVKGRYMWTRTTTTYTDNTDSVTYSVAYQATDGQKGDKGDEGTGVSSSAVTYAQSTSGTTTPTSWSGTRPSPVKGQYLWTRTIISYTNGTSSTAYSTSYYATDGQKGDKGDTGDRGPQGPQGATGSQGPRGATGTSVESVTEYYLATSASSGIVATDTRFTTAIQTMTATNKYLWNYEKINFSDGTSQPTIPVIIGVYGDKGQTGSTGATGRSITSITEHYLATSASSGVTRSTSGWSTTMKTTTETNKYLWNYETINWSSGTTPTYVEPIIIGVHGAKGPQGAQGPQGIQGPAGDNGKSQYTHIRYSANANGSSMTTTPVSTTKYIGIAVTNSSSAPVYTGFTWSKYVGDNGSQGPQGPQGVQGPAGANGQPTYTWVKYASDKNGGGMSDYPEGKRFIGLAFNKTTATESTTPSHYQWSEMPQNIEIGGRNLFSVNQYASLRNSEGTSNGNRYSVGSSGALVVDGVDGSGGYDTMRMVDLKANTEYIFTFNIPINDRFSIYDTDGVAVSVAKNWNSDSTQLTFKMGNVDGYIGGKFYPVEQEYPAEIYLMAEKGNIATDWTEAPEDAKAKLDETLGDYVTIEDNNKTLGEITTNLNDYLALVEQTKNAVNGLLDEDGNLLLNEEGEPIQGGIVTEIEKLFERAVAVENNLGEFTETWNFEVSQITMGEEGLFVGNDGSDMGILIAPDRVVDGKSIPAGIYFMDGGSTIAFISGQMMQINRGIFVESAQIGEHQIETISGGHTIFKWIPK